MQTFLWRPKMKDKFSISQKLHEITVFNIHPLRQVTVETILYIFDEDLQFWIGLGLDYFWMRLPVKDSSVIRHGPEFRSWWEGGWILIGKLEVAKLDFFELSYLSKNLARVQNCPDTTILISLFCLCLFICWSFFSKDSRPLKVFNNNLRFRSNVDQSCCACDPVSIWCHLNSGNYRYSHLFLKVVLIQSFQVLTFRRDRTFTDSPQQCF